MIDLGQAIVTFLSGTILAAVLNWLVNRRKPEVDRGQLEISREKQANETYDALIRALREEVHSYREEMKALRNEVTELRLEVRAQEERVGTLRAEADRLRIERNEARDLARGLWNLAEQSGTQHPWERPSWL